MLSDPYIANAGSAYCRSRRLNFAKNRRKGILLPKHFSLSKTTAKVHVLSCCAFVMQLLFHAQYHGFDLNLRCIKSPDERISSLHPNPTNGAAANTPSDPDQTAGGSPGKDCLRQSYRAEYLRLQQHPPRSPHHHRLLRRAKLLHAAQSIHHFPLPYHPCMVNHSGSAYITPSHVRKC